MIALMYDCCSERCSIGNQSSLISLTQSTRVRSRSVVKDAAVDRKYKQKPKFSQVHPCPGQSWKISLSLLRYAENQAIQFAKTSHINF